MKLNTLSKKWDEDTNSKHRGTTEIFWICSAMFCMFGVAVLKRYLGFDLKNDKWQSGQSQEKLCSLIYLLQRFSWHWPLCTTYQSQQWWHKRRSRRRKRLMWNRLAGEFYADVNVKLGLELEWVHIPILTSLTVSKLSKSHNFFWKRAVFLINTSWRWQQHQSEEKN